MCNLQFSMDDKKQVFLVLHSWLQTRRGMTPKQHVHHHTTWLHTLILQWTMFKCQVSWRNSAFLSFLWVSVACPSLHPPIQATLLLLKWPTDPQRDLLENSYLVTLAPGKSQEIWVFIDRAEPKNEVAQLPGQWRRHTENTHREEKCGLKREQPNRDSQTYKEPGPSFISTSPGSVWVNADHRGLCARVLRVYFSTCASHNSTSHLYPLIKI